MLTYIKSQNFWTIQWKLLPQTQMKNLIDRGRKACLEEDCVTQVAEDVPNQAKQNTTELLLSN